MIRNPFKLLQTLTPKPQLLPAKDIFTELSDKERNIIRQIGITSTQMQYAVQGEIAVNYDRSRFYQEITRALEHWLVAPALELYADYVSNYNQMHGASVWITSDNPTYQKELTKLLDRIGIEEKIFDWAWTTGGYGDMFVEVKGSPNLGVISINDDEFPLNISRIDHEGSLIGFYKTPQGQSTSNPEAIIPPWEWCLRGDTKISLLDGSTPTIQEMADNPGKYVGKHCLSINPTNNKLEPDEIVDVKKTRENAQLVRVHLDNSKFIDCTPNHKIMMRDGSYRQAQDLQPGDSLMPLYIEISGNWLSGYKTVYDPIDGIFRYEHRVVSEFVNGSTPKGCHIHHKDFNKLNNDPSNLNVMLSKDHITLHDFEHSENCVCACCMAKRGGRPEHKIECTCGVCKAIRGEMKGNGIGRLPRIIRQCACGCGQTFIVKEGGTRRCDGKKRFIAGHQTRTDYAKTKMANQARHGEGCNCCICKNVRGELVPNMGWSSLVTRTCKVCGEIFEGIKLADFANHVKGCRRQVGVPLNHKVIKVELLQDVADVYDLMTKRNHNFPLEAGIFVHNCHFRNLGAKRKRPMFSDPLYAEFRTAHLMSGTDTKQVTSRYGTSLLINSLPTYKRLRLAEDSLLMARLTRGILRYIWKLKVTGSNAESINECIQQVAGVLKKARAMDTSAGSPNFDSKFSVLAANEDLLIPVFGEVGDLAYDKIGGEVDIRWIKDIEELRQELACTLRVPLQLLGGFVKEATGDLGSSAIEKLDIRFARNARRLQRSLRTGIKRICQIHLAYMNYDPDPVLFDVQMSETSTAEEEELRDSLDKGVDVISRIIDMMEAIDPNIDKLEVADYLNKKILKLEDFNLRDFIKRTGVLESQAQSKPQPVSESSGNKPNEIVAGALLNTDLSSYLPIGVLEDSEEAKSLNEAVEVSDLFTLRWGKDWYNQWSKWQVEDHQNVVKK